LWKIVAGRQFEIPEIEELITKRTVGPLQGFRSKLGRPFAAIIKLTPELKPEFDFGQQNEESQAAAEALDFTGKEVLGKCPQCGSPVYENGMNYTCEKAARRQGCSFRTGKIILQRSIDRERKRSPESRPNRKSRRSSMISARPNRWRSVQSAAARFLPPIRITFAKKRRRKRSRANSRWARTFCSSLWTPYSSKN
jgi:hypothetical protein